VSITVADLVARVRAEADTPADAAAREQIKRVAAEFESMLMLQMLKEMRKSGSWEDESEREHADGFGTQTMLETIDVELASHLSKVQGFGLAQQMLRGLEGAAGHVQSDRPNASAVPVGSAGPSGLAESPSGPVAENGANELEMPDGQVTSAFGWRPDPFTGASRFHHGIDIRAAYGQDIQTAGPGRVMSAGLEGGYGETVVIEHAGGVRTRYAHLSAALVAPGDEVTSGQVIGRAGHSGRATGTHLHFEVTTASGSRVDPAQFERFKADGMVADLTVGLNPGQESRTE